MHFPQYLLPDLIDEHLYLSSRETERRLDVLRHFGITHILQVGAELEPTHPEDFQYLHFALHDQEYVDIASCLPAALKFIQEAVGAGGNVLVHCRAGVSRSATIVIAYMMQSKQLSLEDAILYVRKRRWGVLPNTGFLCQLLEFEQLKHDLSTYQGWGWQRWFEHPLAQAAQQLRDQLLYQCMEDPPASVLESLAAVQPATPSLPQGNPTQAAAGAAGGAGATSASQEGLASVTETAQVTAGLAASVSAAADFWHTSAISCQASPFAQQVAGLAVATADDADDAVCHTQARPGSMFQGINLDCSKCS